MFQNYQLFLTPILVANMSERTTVKSNSTSKINMCSRKIINQIIKNFLPIKSILKITAFNSDIIDDFL